MVRKSKSEASGDIKATGRKRKKKTELDDGETKPKRKSVEIQEVELQSQKRKSAKVKIETDTTKKTHKVKNEKASPRRQKSAKVHDEKKPPTRKKSAKVKVEKETYTRKKVASLKGESLQDVKPVKLTKSTSGRTKFVGAHCSIAGGLYKAVLQSVEMGGTAFGMFLKSQRQWASKPLAEKDAIKFRETCQEYNFAPHLIVPHGSYLMNCGSPDAETLQKSRDALVDELQRCEMLGLTLFNFHPGSTCGKIDVQECISKIAESINLAHKKTKYVIAVIENMSCQGNTIGGKFSELRDIIDQVKDKSRVGVCLDTCHAFAAGYDSTTQEGYDTMMEEFGRIVGFKFLKAMHFNDSKGPCGCHLDRHENIGKGKIGLDGFRRYMNDPRLDNIPFVLETPEGDYGKEIKKLYSLCKK